MSGSCPVSPQVTLPPTRSVSMLFAFTSQRCSDSRSARRRETSLCREPLDRVPWATPERLEPKRGGRCTVRRPRAGDSAFCPAAPPAGRPLRAFLGRLGVYHSRRHDPHADRLPPERMLRRQAIRLMARRAAAEPLAGLDTKDSAPVSRGRVGCGTRDRGSRSLERHALRGALFAFVAGGYACGRLVFESLRELPPGTRFTVQHAISMAIIVTSATVLLIGWK